MVVSFAKDNGTDLDLGLVSSQVKMGDLSSVLQAYESEIKKPGMQGRSKQLVQSLITGSLIRTLLIQVQKAKVDGALALSALDKLLQSNELNFAFLAFIPTLLISYSTINYLWSWSGTGRKMKLSNISWEIKRILRDMERLVLLNDRQDEEIGQLLCYLVRLDRMIRLAPFTQAMNDILLEDAADLERAILEDCQSSMLYAIFNRMHRILN
jgi:nuclear-control-of-ATPase protein 2